MTRDQVNTYLGVGLVVWVILCLVVIGAALARGADASPVPVISDANKLAIVRAHDKLAQANAELQELKLRAVQKSAEVDKLTAEFYTAVGHAYADAKITPDTYDFNYDQLKFQPKPKQK